MAQTEGVGVGVVQGAVGWLADHSAAIFLNLLGQMWELLTVHAHPSSLPPS